MVEDDDKLDEIRKLYPQMTDEELRIAQDTYRRYLKVLWDIAERLHAEGKSINDLTK
jgi:hypothetical protein